MFGCETGTAQSKLPNQSVEMVTYRDLQSKLASQSMANRERWVQIASGSKVASNWGRHLSPAAGCHRYTYVPESIHTWTGKCMLYTCINKKVFELGNYENRVLDFVMSLTNICGLYHIALRTCNLNGQCLLFFLCQLPLPGMLVTSSSCTWEANTRAILWDSVQLGLQRDLFSKGTHTHKRDEGNRHSMSLWRSLGHFRMCFSSLAQWRIEQPHCSLSSSELLRQSP